MACMIRLDSIYLQAASSGSGNWKARSHSFVMCTVRNRTFSSAAAPLLKLPPSLVKMSFNFYNKKVTRVLNKTRSSSIGQGEREEESVSLSAAPLLILPPSFEEDDSGGKTVSFNFFSPVDNKVTRLNKRRSSIGEEEEELSFESAVLMGCSHGWLALRKGKGQSINYDMFLYNPISARTIKLPPVQTIPPIPPLTEDEEAMRRHWARPDKVILSCPPPNEDEESDSSSNSSSCRAILLYGGTVAVCCPGLSTEWTPFGAFFHEGDGVSNFFGKARFVRSYDDFVYSTRRKQLFCITRFQDLEAWDISDPGCPKLNWKGNIDDEFEYDNYKFPWLVRSETERILKRDFCDNLTHLVFSEHSDRLFLVQRNFLIFLNDTVAFEVHEIIRKEGGGGEMRLMDGTLDGMALFVSDTHAFAVESPGTMGLLPNSIYYTDPSHLHAGRRPVIFDYGEESNPSHRLPGYDTDMLDHEPVPAPMWFTPSPIP